QTDEVHQQITDLLKQLRKLQDKQVSLDVCIVGLPKTRLEELGDRFMRGATSPQVITISHNAPDIVDAIRNHPSAKATTLPKVTLFNGQAIALKVGSEGKFVHLQTVVRPDRRS